MENNEELHYTALELLKSFLSQTDSMIKVDDGVISTAYEGAVKFTEWRQAVDTAISSGQSPDESVKGVTAFFCRPR